MLLILEDVLESNEIGFLRATWSRVVLGMDDSKFKPNGARSGSLLSPVLFNIYFQKVLRSMQAMSVDMEGILAYADDLLIICDSPCQLSKVIVKLKEELESLGLVLNAKKSAVVEFVWRNCRTRSLSIKSKVERAPVENFYRYLGLYLDSKLTIFTHLNKLREKLLYQAEALGKVLFQFSAGYRKDL